MNFNKPALSHQKLLELMKQRGLPLNLLEEGQLRAAFKRIGYYRLTGYMLPFQHTSGWKKHHFKQGATLEKIVRLYEFDSALRVHCMEAIEQIEVKMRTVVCDHMSSQLGSHWYLSPSAFKPGKQALRLESLAKAAEFDLATNRHFTKQSNTHLFISEYYRKYTSPAMPPSWMLRECASFGTWAMIYADLPSGNQKQIADDWTYPSGQRIDHAMLENWFHSISIFRNRCAHHSRITGRRFPFPPKISTEQSVRHLFGANADDLRTLLVLLDILLKCVNPKSNWSRRLNIIFESHSSVDIPQAIGKYQPTQAYCQSEPLFAL